MTGRTRFLARLVVLVACLLALPAAGARAGTYEVFACGGAAGGVSGAFGAVADTQMAAYMICPNTPSNPVSGLVTRASATAGPGAVSHLAGAYQIFEAPPGASLVSVSLDLAAIRLASYWTTGIVAYDGNFNVGDRPYGCYAGASGCAIGQRSFFGPVTVGLGGHSKFRFETRCVNAGGCDISSSGFTPGMRALFSAANVRVQVQDYSNPAIRPLSGALWNSGWHRGHEEAWELATDNVGVARLRLLVDGVARETQDYRNTDWPPGIRCDFTARRPCNDITGGLSLDTGALADGHHSMRIEATDAAGNTSVLDRGIDVDNTAPGRVNATADGGTGWRRSNDFTVRWPEPAGQGAATAAARYKLCTTGRSPRCWTGAKPALSSVLAGLKVPDDGEYRLRVWLEDQAGNASESNASDPIELRLDNSPPERASFELIDDDDPRRVDVAASDATSGLGGGTIEIRRSGHRQWHALPTKLLPGGLSAYIDDVGLPNGRYELRGRVTDRAGNERVSERREDGSRMEIELPVRSQSRIALRRRALRTGRFVRGHLGVGGRPLAGSAVDVLEQPRTASRLRLVRTIRTNSRGVFRYRLVFGPSRTIRFRYVGTPRIKPAIEAVALRVPARTTIATGRSRLTNGESVEFRGRLLGRPLPEGGKLIDLQAYYRGSWRTFATPRTDPAGRWSFRYRFEATHGLVRYRFRARIRREAAYPYELGYSRAVKVTVRG